MFIVSKLKEVIGRGSTGNNRTEGEALKSNEECKEKETEVAQCSEFEEMDTQDFSDSPILFSQEDKQRKEEDEEDDDSDCYEIVDKTSLEKEKRAKNMKDKSRLSLGRKRQVSEQSGQASINNTSNKQRRVVNEDDALSKTEHPKIEHDEELCLPRVYKKPTRETVEEADRNNFYFAPRHVNPVLYTPVIVRKFESYRRRLRRVQSDLRSLIRPLHFKAIDPVSGRSRGRVGARVKRKSLVPHYKKWAEHKKDNDPFVAALCEILAAMEPTRSAAEVVHIVDPFSDSETPTESEQQTNGVDVVCAKVSPRTTSKTAETSRDGTTSRTAQHADVSTTDDDAMETVNNDVATEAGNCNVTMETVENDGDMKTVNKNVTTGTVKRKVVMKTVENDVGMKTVNKNVTTGTVKRKVVMKTVENDVGMKTVNKNVTMGTVKRKVVMKTVENDVGMKTVNKNVTTGTVNRKETVNNETSSPVKPVLDEKRRKTILEEASSDDDLQKFNFQRPVLPEEPKVEEADCVVVEAVTTVAKEPSRQQTPECIECPMCYKKFPKDTIHHHAFLCNGVDEASTSSVRTVDVQDGQMSPVIKTRTPTKVKELKLLANVETKAKEVENKEVKRTGEANMNKKRISLEPRIRLKHVETAGMKCGESMTKRKQTDIKENEKNQSTPPQNINQTLHRRRLSNTRKNLEKSSWPDVASLKKDFLPLEFVEQENEKIPSKDVHKVLSLVDADSTESSSDEEFITKKPVASKRKSMEADDEMSALSLMATDYKGRKRKKDRNIKNNPKKVKVSSEEEIGTVHCFICGKDIPRLQFTEHVNEEIARQAKEDEEKDSNFSMMLSMSQNSQSDGTDENTTSHSRLPLPDLAEGTTRSTNNEADSTSKTFKPIQEGSDYHKQFSFSDDKGQSDRNKGKGRGRRGRGSSWRRK